MQIYDAPLRDMRFVLNELFADSPYAVAAGSDDLSPDLVDAILEEASKFARNVLLPLNAAGDQEGCRFENGRVSTPKGFKDAYQQFCTGGWPGLSASPEWGGQGLPETLNKLVEEMVCASNVAFSLYPVLTHGAVKAIEAHASEALKHRYLPKMVSGEWSGAMNLTEAHSGTDLGLLRTKAEPRGDGSYGVTGSKIFISSGDHDMADNIIHLVLARLPDAPPGTKGVSLFLVPKFLPNEDGSLGERNAVFVAGVEHKMGMKGSATCQLSFEGAIGWMVGEPHKGLAAMFTMMNTERVAVGVQGLGVAVAAYQAAVAYAKDRVQGRSLSGPKRPDLPADPIIVHPDVRRMLMTMRAYTEGGRALCQWVSQALVAERNAEDLEVRASAADFVALFTPVVKALFTDIGFEAANLAVQVHGGHGYIREHGVEQYVRDARIFQIYEGANGVQALDLVGRKLPMAGGRLLKTFFGPVGELIKAQAESGDRRLAGFSGRLHQAFEALEQATRTILWKSAKDPEEAAAAASDYLRLMGFVALGYTFLKATAIARRRIEDGEDVSFFEAKLVTAAFFFDRLLPKATAAFLALNSGKRSTMALPVEAF